MKHDFSVDSLPESTEHSVCDLFILVVAYGHFVTNYLSPLQSSSSPLKMGEIGCPENSVTNY